MKRYMLLGILSLGLCTAVLGQETLGGTAADRQFVFAYRLLQRGEDASAARAFDEFLGQFPSDVRRPDALYYRAMLLRKAGDSRGALQLVEQVQKTTFAPGYAAALLKGQLEQELGQHEQALVALESIDADKLEPLIRATVQALRGAAYRGAGNLPAAEMAFAAAAGVDSPLQGRSLLNLAQVQVQLNKLADARASAEKCLAIDDNALHAEAAYLAGELAYRLNDYAKAAELYRRIVTGHQSSRQFSPAVLGLMWAHLQARQYDQLLLVQKQFGNMLAPEDRATALYLAGSAQQATGHHELAIEQLAQAARAAGSSFNDRVLYKLAVSHFELRQDAACLATLEKLIKAHPQSPVIPDVQFLLAGLDVRRSDAVAAAARFKAIIDQGPKAPYYAQALLQRAQLYEQGKQVAAAINDYESYLAAAGEQAPGAQDALVHLIDLHYQLNQFEPAQKYVKQLLNRPGLAPLIEQQVLYRQALVQIQQKQHESALQTIDRLLAKHPQNTFQPQCHYYRGLLLVSLGKTEAGIEALGRSVDDQQLPRELRINALRLATIQLRQAGQLERAAAMMQRLEQVQGVENLTPEDQLWMGRYQLDTGDAEAAAKYLRPLVDPAGDAPLQQRTQALFLLAQAQQKLGQTQQAIDNFRQVVAIDMGLGLRARLALGQLLKQQQDWEGALAQLAGLFNSEDAGIAARAIYDSALAYRELAQARRRNSNLTGAQQAIDQARWCLVRLTVVFNSPKLSPLPELSFIELADLEAQAEQQAQARKALDELILQFPDTPYALYAKALIALQESRQNEAMALLDQVRRNQEVEPTFASRVAAQLKQLEATP